jgi:hypothetical protein
VSLCSEENDTSQYQGGLPNCVGGITPLSTTARREVSVGMRSQIPRKSGNALTAFRSNL